MFVALGSRAAVGQALVLLALPLLARLYGPEAFGIYGTIIAVTGIGIIAGTASLDLAMMESRHRRRHQDLLVLAMVSGLAATVLATVGGAVYFAALGEVDSLGMIAGAFWVLAITLPGIAFHLSVATRLTVRGPEAAGRLHIGRGVVIVVVATAGYWLFDGAAGLLLGHALGFLLVTSPVASMRTAWRLSRHFSLRLARGWSRARGYVGYMMPQSVLSSGSQQGAVLIVGLLAGLPWAGIYWLAFRAVGIPNTLMGKSLRQVSLRTISGIPCNARRARFVQRATLVIALCYLPIPAFLWWFGEPAFGLIFGPEWRAAADIGFWLSCWLGLGLVNAPAHMMLTHADRKKQLLGLEFVSSVVRLSALTWGLLYYDVIIATAAFAFAGILGNLFMITWGVRVSRRTILPTDRAETPGQA